MFMLFCFVNSRLRSLCSAHYDHTGLSFFSSIDVYHFQHSLNISSLFLLSTPWGPGELIPSSYYIQLGGMRVSPLLPFYTNSMEYSGMSRGFLFSSLMWTNYTSDTVLARKQRSSLLFQVWILLLFGEHHDAQWKEAIACLGLMASFISAVLCQCNKRCSKFGLNNNSTNLYVHTL